MLRVAHVLALRHLPLFDRPIGDAEYYDTWSRTIAAGDWMGGDRAFFFDPLYTYVLAVIYRLVGHDLLLVRLLQVGFGIATCALIAWIGRRVAGPAAGNLAAFFVAVYKPAIFQDSELEKTALGVFLVTAALAAVMTRRRMMAVISGVALGLAALTRGNMLLVAPLLAAYLLAEPLRPPARAAAGPWQRRILGPPGGKAALFLAGFFGVLAPVAWRNHHVSGEWILTTAGAGTNFYTGNNPSNATGGFQTVPFVRPQSQHEEEDFRAEAERRTGIRLGPKELSDYWFAESLRHMREHPGFAATVMARKAVLFWSDVELADSWDMAFLSRYSPVLRLPLLGLVLLLPSSVIGAAIAWRRSQEARLLVAYALLYFVSLVGFFVFSRYRIHVLPALAVLAAAGVFWIAEQVRARELRRVAVAGVCACAVALFSAFGAQAFVGVQRGTLNSTVNLAGLYMEKRQFGEAAALLRDALEENPGSAAVLCRAGELGLRTGDLAGARDAYTACLAANPGYPDAWYHLGAAYEGLGQRTSAADAYRRQLESVPGHELAARRLAGIGSEAR